MSSLILIAALALTSVSDVGMRHFESKSQAFSTDYPADWNLVGSSSLGSSESRLDIVSFPDNQRSEGIVIKQGGAEIILRRGNATDEIETGDKLIQRRKITLSSTSLCPTATVTRVISPIVTKEEAPSGMAIYEDNTTYQCSGGAESFELILRHFKGDQQHERYERTAIVILDGLRSSSNRTAKK
jgi:hypothetical protein